MKKLLLLPLLLAAMNLFAEIKVETFDTKTGGQTSGYYMTEPTTMECSQASWTVFYGGIKKGMGKVEIEEKLAVECGYWNNFRFRPNAEGEEKKFCLDSPEPNFDKYQEFLDGEVRYSSLALKDKEKALRLFEKNQNEAKARYTYLKALGNLYATPV